MSVEQYALGTFADGGDEFPGLVVNDRVVDLRSAFGGSVTTLDLLSDWDRKSEILANLAESSSHAWIDVAALTVLPPVRPRQLLLAGANYFGHVQQMFYASAKRSGDTRPDEVIRAEVAEAARRRRDDQDPFIFTGLVGSISGPFDDIVLWGPGIEHDWELELAVVIGKPGFAISREDAIGHVAGYTIANDISTRDVMHRPNFRMTDFLMTKSRPTFHPLGPYIVPKKFVPDPHALRIRLSVNGELMQDESVEDIIYGVEELISYASTVARLLPGDVLLTGSPAGNAAHHGNRWLTPGDVIEGEITGLGRQRNTCKAPPRIQAWDHARAAADAALPHTADRSAPDGALSRPAAEQQVSY